MAIPVEIGDNLLADIIVSIMGMFSYSVACDVRVHLEMPPFLITRNFFFKSLTYIPTQLKKCHNRKNGGGFGQS